MENAKRPRIEETHSLDENITEEENKLFFNSMVLSEMIKNLPGTMPSFDRINIIEAFKNELGPVTITSIPWHKVIINQDDIK